MSKLHAAWNFATGVCGNYIIVLPFHQFAQGVIEMKKAVCFAISLALCTTSALADSSSLSAGKPAGVRQAQDWDTNTTMIIGVLALAGAGIAIAASAGNAGGPTASTSPSTSTSTSTTSTTGTTS